MNKIKEFNEINNYIGVHFRNTDIKNNLNDIINKIKELTKTNPEYQFLLESLPNPDINGKDLSLLEMQLRNQFINTFSQPYIPLKFASWWKDEINSWDK